MNPNIDSIQPENCVQASDILNKIKTGMPVDYTHVLITGELNLDQLTQPDDKLVISSEIHIQNCIIEDDLKFANTEFQKPVVFEATTFKGGANFGGSKFTHNVNFEVVQFTRDTSFRKATFTKNVRFKESQFSRIANFNGVHFDGSVNFNKAFFGGDSKFKGVKFNKNAHFGTDPGTDPSSSKVVCFVGPASFWEAQFSGNAYFYEAQFRDDAHFSRARFCGDTYFDRAQFRGVADFWSAQFSDDAHFDNAQFDNRLDLSNFKIDRFYISWALIKDNIVYDGPAYLAIIKNFNFIEQFEEADDCYYQYRKKSQDRKKLYNKECGWNLSKLLDIIAWISCGYGVRPTHTAICMFSVVVISGVAFLGKFDSLFESFYFSLMTFTGSMPDNLTPERWLRVAAMVEAVLGYSLMALFVVVFAHKLIR